MPPVSGFCAECRREVTVEDGDALVCPVCGSELLGPDVEKERKRRIGENEAAFRRINELRAAESEAGEFSILCECGYPTCDERILVGRDEYEAVRSNPARFFALSEHEFEEFEIVIERRARFNVVEKRGEAGHSAAG